MIDTNDNGFVTFNEVESLFDGNVRSLKNYFKFFFLIILILECDSCLQYSSRYFGCY